MKSSKNNQSQRPQTLELTPPIVQTTASSLCFSFHVVAPGCGSYEDKLNPAQSLHSIQPMYLHGCSCEVDQVAGSSRVIMSHHSRRRRTNRGRERDCPGAEYIESSSSRRKRQTMVRDLKCRRGIFLSGRRIYRAADSADEMRLHDNAATAGGSYRYH